MIYLKNDIDSNLYKYTKNNDMGKYVRNMYDIGKTNNEKEFMEVLKNVLSNSKKV